MLLLFVMASGIGDGSPQFDYEVIGESESLQIGCVNSLGKVHRIGFLVGKIPDLRRRRTGVRSREVTITQNAKSRDDNTCVASSASLIPMKESSSMLMASIPTCVHSSCYKKTFVIRHALYR